MGPGGRLASGFGLPGRMLCPPPLAGHAFRAESDALDGILAWPSLLRDEGRMISLGVSGLAGWTYAEPRTGERRSGR